MKACTKLQGHSTSGVCPINQLAALAAITAPREFFVPVRAALRRRRDLLAIGLAAIPGFELGPTAQGAFYLFPRIDALFGRTSPTGRVLRSGLDVADWLIHEGGIAVVPGEAFGEGRCIRISYAVGVEVLEAGVSRIEAAVRALR